MRNAERKALGELNAAPEKIRYPLAGRRKEKCKSTQSKVFLLLQLRAGGLGVGEFHSADSVLRQQSHRILSAVVEFAESEAFFGALLAAQQLKRGLQRAVGWCDAPQASVQQFNGIGLALASKLCKIILPDVPLPNVPSDFAAPRDALQALLQLGPLHAEQVSPTRPRLYRTSYLPSLNSPILPYLTTPMCPPPPPPSRSVPRAQSLRGSCSPRRRAPLKTRSLWAER